MLRILVPALAAAALALPAPAALADDPMYDCQFVALQQTDATGVNFTGFAVGYVTHAEGTAVSIRCVVTVNGTEATGTTSGANGAGHAVTYGRVDYAAAEGEVVELCAQVETTHGAFESCEGTTTTQVPPDVLNEALCVVFEAIGANGGVKILELLLIDEDGDVFVLDRQVVDCGDDFDNPTPLYRPVQVGGRF